MTFKVRSAIVICILLITGYIVFFSLDRLQEVPILKSLDELPKNIGEWELADRIYLKDEIVDMLGVDQYTEAVYTSPGKPAIDLYISYFNVLKEGKQFHSPKNCLIGSGSYLESSEVIKIPLDDAGNFVPVSFMVLQKGDTRQLILYWFHCRGRVMSSEYKERVYRVLDAIFKKRTDGAFIRIVAYDNDRDIRDTCEMLTNFAHGVIPLLDLYIPGR